MFETVVMGWFDRPLIAISFHLMDGWAFLLSIKIVVLSQLQCLLLQKVLHLDCTSIAIPSIAFHAWSALFDDRALAFPSIPARVMRPAKLIFFARARALCSTL